MDHWQKVNSFLMAGNIADSIQFLEQELAGCEGKRFKFLLRENFRNDPGRIGNDINTFVINCEKHFDIKAVYLEMNGFDINPDRWFFDFFGYKTLYNNTDDIAGFLDWLAYWDSQDWPDVTLLGLEKTQKEFDWYSNKNGYKDDSAQLPEELATLLVMCKFTRLIQKSVQSGKIEKKIPIFATAHDFDIIPKFMP
jgi:hypothetical protein